MSQPLVSIIIRTCARPQVLRQALNSVREQTYANIETIVVEDGINDSENMIRKEFSDMKIRYYSSGTKVGRSHIGNLGLEKSTGEYLNFLDDDDILYKEHVQCLIDEIERFKCKIVYSVAEERQIVVTSYAPYLYKVRRSLIRFRQPYNQVLLCHSNYLPIQSVMFDRSLFQRAGGFDESLNALEDWDLWVRYSTFERLFFVDQVTSAYYVPYGRKSKMKRDKKMHDSQCRLHEKFSQYNLTTDVGQIHEDMDFIIKKYKNGKVKRYLRLAVDFLMYGER